MKTLSSSLLVCLLFALACGGCVRSERPLSPTKEAKEDPRLTGMWRVVKGDSEHEDRVFRVTFKDGIGLLSEFKEDRTWASIPRIQGFVVTRTLKASYLSVLAYDDEQDKPDASKKQHFIFLRYQISDDGETMNYWQMKTSYFQQAVQDKKLVGQGVDGGVPTNAETVYLRDTSDNLLRFVDTLPEDAFEIPVEAVKLTIKVK